jgi:hypothetical protein
LHVSAVDEHIAGTALPEAAAEAGAHQLEVIAQNIEQGCIGLRSDRMLDVIYIEAYGYCHAALPKS